MEASSVLPLYQPIEDGGIHNADLSRSDNVIFTAIADERDRQRNSIELIASENFVSPAVLEAQGSILTNKYAEGYPHRRYYGGCANVDVVEGLAIERVKQLFGSAYANVQPHSGSQANQAVFLALLNPGDTILGLDLKAGGHLTHGAPVNMSGRWFNVVSYGVDPDSHLIDMDQVAELARQNRPKILIAGGSAYPRVMDFARFREIADEVGAVLMVDMAHFAGLVAGDAYPSPVGDAAVRLMGRVALFDMMFAAAMHCLADLLAKANSGRSAPISPENFGNGFGRGDVDLNLPVTFLMGLGY